MASQSHQAERRRRHCGQHSTVSDLAVQGTARLLQERAVCADGNRPLSVTYTTALSSPRSAETGLSGRARELLAAALRQGPVTLQQTLGREAATLRTGEGARGRARAGAAWRAVTVRLAPSGLLWPVRQVDGDFDGPGTRAWWSLPPRAAEGDGKGRARAPSLRGRRPGECRCVCACLLGAGWCWQRAEPCWSAQPGKTRSRDSVVRTRAGQGSLWPHPSVMSRRHGGMPRVVTGRVTRVRVHAWHSGHSGVGASTGHQSPCHPTVTVPRAARLREAAWDGCLRGGAGLSAGVGICSAGHPASLRPLTASVTLCSLGPQGSRGLLVRVLPSPRLPWAQQLLSGAGREAEPHTFGTWWKGLDHHACQVGLPSAPATCKTYLVGPFRGWRVGRAAQATGPELSVSLRCLTVLLTARSQVHPWSSHGRWKSSTFIASGLYVGTGVLCGTLWWN